MINTTQFWLIRHGETQWNADKRLQGWMDIPLNSIGIKQAQRLAEHLRSASFDAPIDLVLSSDLARAAETARIAAVHLGFPVQVCAQLRERGFGIYEGQDWVALDGLKGAHGLDFRDPDQLIEQGETLNAFQGRISAAFEDLAQRYKGRNILVFSHGGVIDIVWRKVSKTSIQAPRLDLILNTSINHFSIDEDRNWRAIDWGQIAHLETEALDDIG